jgi:UDP-glucose 4-epimerase
VVHSGADPWRLTDLTAHVRIVQCDLEDQSAVRAALREQRPDWVFHLAAHGAYSFQKDVARIARTNVVGTTNLLEAVEAAGCVGMVNTGSSSEYGAYDHAPLEDEICRPASVYAVTKLASTQLCQVAARRLGIPIPTLRLYSAYGPWEDPRRLIPQLVAHALNERWPPLAAPATVRDFVYVADVVEAYLLASTIPLSTVDRVFNIGSGRQVTLHELVEVSGRVLHVKAPPDFGSYPARDWDVPVWVANARRARDELGWSSQTSLEVGIAAMAAWLRARPEYAVGRA